MRKPSRRKGHYYSIKDKQVDASALRANWSWRRGATRGQVTAEFMSMERRA